MESKFKQDGSTALLGIVASFDSSQLEDTLPRFIVLSSGMVARLGFAIATDVQPDILILDEVLSVGDESFKNKCKQRIEKFWAADATVLVVSHDLEFVKQSCEWVIWLEKGKVKLIGDTKQVVQDYLTSTNMTETASTHL